MKHILTIILIITFLGAKAQQTTNTPYYTDPDLKRFSGEWQCITNDTTFLINLKFVKKYVKAPGDFYIDAIEGDYTVKKDGQVLQASINNKGINAGTYVDRHTSKDKIKFFFYDLGRNSKTGLVVFELLNNGTNKARWVLKNVETVIIGNRHYDLTFSVPRNMILTKVK